MAYSDKVLDHYSNPKNVGTLDKSKSSSTLLVCISFQTHRTSLFVSHLLVFLGEVFFPCLMPCFRVQWMRKKWD